MKKIMDKEIDALISLLDDPDEDVYQMVRQQLVSIGEQVIPRLENSWEFNSFGLVFQSRIEDIIHIIQYERVYKNLEQWSRHGAQDLFEGALHIARYQYPDLNEVEVKNELLKIRQDIWLELNDNLTALEQVKVFNKVLFEQHGFRGNKKNYHAAQNSYINTVIETRKGNPLSLSILYIVLAASVDVPVYGINLPSHFILAYVDKYNILKLLEKTENSLSSSLPDSNVLFYINPFSKGSILHKTEIANFLNHLKIDLQPGFFNPCDNRTIIVRLINNLIFSYDRLGYPAKVRDLKQLLKAVYPQ